VEFRNRRYYRTYFLRLQKAKYDDLKGTVYKFPSTVFLSRRYAGSDADSSGSGRCGAAGGQADVNKRRRTMGVANRSQ